MRGRPRPLVVLAAIALAGCNGDGDAAPTTTAPATTTSTSTSTSTSTTSTTITTSTTATVAPSTTDQVPSTPATDTTPTSIDFAELEVEVSAAMVAFIDTTNALFRDPSSSERRDDLAEVGTGRALEFFLAQADDFVEERRFARVDPSEPGRVDPIVESLGTEPSGTTAGMQGCLIDSDHHVFLDESGAEIRVETVPASFLMTFTFELIDGGWYVEQLTIEQSFDDQVGCS